MGGLNVSAGLVLGFGVGAVVGFLWSQGTKSALASNTTTTVDGEAITVRVNYLKAAAQGFAESLSR